MTDEQGLDKAYTNVNNIYVNRNIMYVSGTHSLADVKIWPQIPLRNIKNTERYIQAKKIMDMYPEVDTLVGHSLGSVISREITLDNKNKIKAARLYGSPNLMRGDKRIEYYRHVGDPFSLSNKILRIQKVNSMYLGNPHSYGGFN